MSRESLEVVRRFFDARNRRDIDGILGCLHPEAEFDLSESRSPYRGVYSGHEDIRRQIEDLFQAWGEFEMALDDPVEADNQVVVSVHVSVVGRGSGVSWQGQGANLFTVEDGKIVRFRLFQTRTQALEAAGLSK